VKPSSYFNFAFYSPQQCGLIGFDHGEGSGIELPHRYPVLLILLQHLPPIALGEGIQKKEAGILFSNGAIEIALNQSLHLGKEKG
jgi:hypothetical protein